MRVSINLATHPFVELRPLFARLRIAMAALAVAAVGLGIGLHAMNTRSRAAEEKMDGLKAQTLAVDTERQTNERRMQQPQNRAVLDRSKFLNVLFASKSFSWTSVMMDLENVLPGGVQVTSIEPQITSDGGVDIRLRVNGDRDREVDLVRNLERSQRFLVPRLVNEAAQTEQPGQAPVAATGIAGAVEFDILSGYNPLPSKPKSLQAKDGEQPEGTDKARGTRPAKAHPAARKAPAVPPKPVAGLKKPLPGGAR